MSQLLETIRTQEGNLQNISFHNRRMMRSMEVLFGIRRNIMLDDYIIIPAYAKSGIFKCRIEYDTEIRKIEFLPYLVRPVRSLKPVESDDLDYSLKFTDRSRLSELFSKRGDCDDILIIKNGMVTDTSYSNIIFRDFSGKWVTPSTFLLPGTRRESLLQTGIIKETNISYSDLKKYNAAKLINAMIGFEDSEEFPVENII
jgi:4-amino-4-deoxychorismate lyase